MSCKILICRGTSHATGGTGEKPEAIHDRRDLVVQRTCVGLTAVQGFHTGEFLTASGDRVRQLE